jgi:hypothetical protein
MIRHKWQFSARFRAGAFGWRNDKAIQRIKEAEKEISSVARKDKILAAEGVILFFRKLEPAVEQVDDSSGRMSGVIGRTIEKLIPVVARAPADNEMRAQWLVDLKSIAETSQYWLYSALPEHWGELCGSDEAARVWLENWLPRLESSL